MSKPLESIISDWDTTPSPDQPRFELEFEWEMADWPAMEKEAVALTATNIEGARAEAAKVIDAHNRKVQPHVAGKAVRARIKTLINLEEISLD